MKKLSLVSSLMALLLLAGCSTAYYGAMEKIGIHKREILVDRVEDAKESQQEAQKQFTSALEQLTSLTQFDGGKLATAYESTKDAYDESEAAAEDVSQRIDDIEDVAEALFVEWEGELEQYTSTKLKADSRQKLRQTQSEYKQLITSMERAESKMTPVLNTLRDNMLYLKHNLNAQAVAGLQGEFSQLKVDINDLLQEMNVAIAQSDQFIAKLK
ncbi:DUF2959 domain-containing protein [Psychromonas sp. PT13]|uniref:DUF2959 domain-containing protein n=1 Tax=Psychromonas sp. PT13 TaxID=3439547 RepID=UPI003EB995E9